MTVAIDYIHHDQEAPVHGLSVALSEFMKAWFRYSSEPRFFCYTGDPDSFMAFSEQAQAYSKNADKPCVHVNPATPGPLLKDFSCLFVPDPDLSKAVWRRARFSGGAYAACGLVHSMSGDQVTRAVVELCLAPTHKADALICPSRAIQSVVRRVWETHLEYLSNRFGTEFSCPVQTPIIPIGIHTDKFQARVTPELRAAQRAALGVGEDDIIILFVGRLNFATKAHPLPLLLAAQKAATLTKHKLKVVLNGNYVPQESEPLFRALLKDFGGPPLECEIVTHNDPRFPHGVWAAADIFTSLVDNIQESFGLTPIEAMACGLPVVVSDWDGYRDTVRHGLDGLLIPTYAPPDETGMEIAEAFYQEEHYGRYLVSAAQSTAVDIEAAARAFATLANNKNRREDMGRQAKARARSVYDWRVIIPAYEQLWRRMGEESLHYANTALLPRDWQAVTPMHPNPWRVFDTFPSGRFKPEDKLLSAMTLEELTRLLHHQMNFFVPERLLPLQLIQDLNETIRANNGLLIKELLAVTPDSETPRVWRTVGWLIKHGVCRMDRG